jgi:hypothetical protein
LSRRECKALGEPPECFCSPTAPRRIALLDKVGVEPDAGVTDLVEGFLAAAAKRFWDREAKLRLLA